MNTAKSGSWVARLTVVKEESSMREQASDKQQVLHFVTGKIWILFSVVLVTLAASAIFGVQPVRAAGCTLSACQSAHFYGEIYCQQNNLGNVTNVVCPDELFGEPDDFDVKCQNSGWVALDCGTSDPS